MWKAEPFCSLMEPVRFRIGALEISDGTCGYQTTWLAWLPAEPAFLDGARWFSNWGLAVFGLGPLRFLIHHWVLRLVPTGLLRSTRKGLLTQPRVFGSMLLPTQLTDSAPNAPRCRLGVNSVRLKSCSSASSQRTLTWWDHFLQPHKEALTSTAAGRSGTQTPKLPPRSLSPHPPEAARAP